MCHGVVLCSEKGCVDGGLLLYLETGQKGCRSGLVSLAVEEVSFCSWLLGGQMKNMICLINLIKKGRAKEHACMINRTIVKHARISYVS